MGGNTLLAWFKLAAGLAILSLVACGDGDNPSSKAPSPRSQPTATATASEFGLKVYVELDGKERLVTVAPSESLPAKLETRPPGSGTQSASEGDGRLGKLQQAATVTQPDGTVIDTDDDVVPGWTLLKWAAISCEQKAPSNVMHELDYGFVGEPWSNPEASFSWYIFHAFDPMYLLSSCDDYLYREEVLLCAADRLAQIGDSASTTQWSTATYTSNTPDPTGQLPKKSVTITIPPQATKDRFIARDLALNALGHLARLTQRVMEVRSGPNGYVRKTCGEFFLEAANTGEIYESDLEPHGGYRWNSVFPQQTWYADPDQVTTFSLENSIERQKAAGRRRIDRSLNLLTAAARLTKDLVERSVRDDISGAQKLFGSGGDARRSSLRAWGLDSGQEPYNNLRHAFRTLYGRLEFGSNVHQGAESIQWFPRAITRDDPRCSRANSSSDVTAGGGTSASDLLQLLSYGVPARWNDVPPSTRGETLALSILGGAGIILPTQIIDDPDVGATMPDVRSAVQELLVRRAADRAEQTYTAFRTTEAATAVRSTVAEEAILDSELRFALDRVYDTFRLISYSDLADLGSPSDYKTALRSGGADAGLTFRPSAGSEEVENIGGAVLQGSLPKAALKEDLFPRFAAGQLASNCGVFPRSIGSGTLANASLSPRAGDVTAMQNVFMLGESFRRTLLHLGHGIADAPKSRSFADLAAAEIRQWASLGTILREEAPEWNVARYYFVDITPRDLGLADDAELASRLVLTDASKPYRAACVAGTRARELCADSLFEANSSEVIRPIAPATVVHDTTYAGSEIYVRRVNFPLTSTAVHVVVAARDDRPGRVLAALPYTKPTSSSPPREFAAEVVSSLQRDLSERAFGVGRPATPERTCSGPAPLALPREYCVAGMARDQFVPLANDLNRGSASGDDSWRHYLDVADSAAKEADEVAKEMVSLGLEDDIRTERAGEEVAEICGTYPADARATRGEDGNIETTGADEALRSCLNPKLVDVTFLMVDPLKGSVADNNERLCTNLCGDAQGSAKTYPFCSKCSSGDEITHSGLGFVDAPAETGDAADSLAACKDLAQSIDFAALRPELKFPQVSAQVRAPWFNQAALTAAISELALVESPNRGWALSARFNPARSGGGADVLIRSVPQSDGTCTLQFPYEPTAPAGSDEGIVKRLFYNDAFNTSSATDCHGAARARVELAMFYLGAMAGGIPAGRISLPVIAANATRGAIGTDTGVGSGWNTYSASRFTLDDNNKWVLRGDGYQGVSGFSLRDTELIPPVEAGSTPVRFFWDRGHKDYVEARQPDALLALPTSNAPITFGSSLTGGDTIVITPDTVSTGDVPNDSWTLNNNRAYVAAWVEDVARAYMEHRTGADGEVANMVQTAAWQSMKLSRVADPIASDGTPLSNLKNKLMIGPARSMCDHAYVSPVFQRYMDGMPFGKTVRNNITCLNPKGCFYREDTNNGKLEQLTGAIKDYGQYTETIGMWQTLGREGGPKAVFPFTGGVGQSDWTEGADPFPGCSFCFQVWSLGHDRLLPTQCPPSERVELNMHTLLDTNESAMKTVLRAVTLACVTENSRRYEATPDAYPPPLETLDDLRYFENWLAIYGKAVERTAGLLFVLDAPRQVIENSQAGAVGVGAVSQGMQGKLFLELGEHLRRIGSGFENTGKLFQEIAAEVRTARLQIEAAGLKRESRELGLALRAIENNRQLALAAARQARIEAERSANYLKGMAELVGGVASLNVGVALGGVGKILGSIEGDVADYKFPTDLEIEQDYGAQIANNLRQQSDNSEQIANNEIAQVIGNMGLKLPGILAMVGDNLTAIRNHTSDFQQNIIDLKQLQASGAVALGKAAGADFVSANGQAVPLHVNTVYRRQFGILKLRYERALERAKRAAYVARLAIEQRIGVRLADLRGPVGPLSAPSTWVDDVCTVQGVDYDALRTATLEQGPSGATEIDRIAGFADQYVGDYISKLREFVEFYNLEHPFKESRDTALISLRESLGDADQRCVAASPNLLFWSDRLDVRPNALGSIDEISFGGWRMSGCSAGACPEVRDGATLKDGTLTLSPPSSPGAATWLASIPRDERWSVSASSTPTNLIYQSVELSEGGTYVLSWWDQARNSTGGNPAANAVTVDYPAAVYDSEWRSVASTLVTPSTSGWSPRRTLVIHALRDGIHHVAFAADQGEHTGAHLAIANVQLEGGDSTKTATPYVANEASRSRLTGKCDLDSADAFRGRFDYKCERFGCYYELRDLLLLDTQLLQQGYSPLTGRVASGNYNYRLGTVALNLVGSGVIDCSESERSSCVDSGYVEYDLVHSAQNVPVEDWSGETRCFDFAIGNIRGGKALATERVLTLPLGNADSRLLSQPAFSKSELVGRPLSGTYSLRIRETPGLVWQKLKDVQLLVQYDYWSRVKKTAGE
jgi:hypothetical protein